MTEFTLLRQHQILSRLLGLSREQGRALTAERLDDFLALMEAREQALAELLSLEAVPAPANIVALPTIQPATTDPDVKAAMRGLIATILEQDEANERELRRRMSDLHAAIGRMNQGAVAGRGYAATLLQTEWPTERASYQA